MRSYHDYPRKNRIAIVVGTALVVAGVIGAIGSYLRVPWWHDFFDTLTTTLDYALPVALILFCAWIAVLSRKGVLPKIMHPEVKRPLVRSRSDRRVFGVCGGFAASRKIDSFYIRVGALLLLIAFPLLSILVYSIITVTTLSE